MGIDCTSRHPESFYSILSCTHVQQNFYFSIFMSNKKIYNHAYESRTKYNSSLNEYCTCGYHVITNSALLHLQDIHTILVLLSSLKASMNTFHLWSKYLISFVVISCNLVISRFLFNRHLLKSFSVIFLPVFL